MIARRLVQLTFRWRTILLAAARDVESGLLDREGCDSPCVWNQKPKRRSGSLTPSRWLTSSTAFITAYGTISVKTPDVWGQDRLAKFRSEYESQMAEWLKRRLQGRHQCLVRRAESESTQVQVGTALVPPSAKSTARRKTIRPVSTRCPRAWQL